LTNLLVVDGFLGPLYLTGGLAASTPDTPPSAAANSLLRVLIANMEKTSVAKYVFEVGAAEPGLDTYDNPLRRKLT
jgi:hypothetical protein